MIVIATAQWYKFTDYKNKRLYWDIQHKNWDFGKVSLHEGYIRSVNSLTVFICATIR
jgi:hypothetical protein